MTSPDASSLPSGDIGRQLAYLQAVVSNMPQGISVFDEQLRLRVWNQGFIKVLNLPAEAVYEGVHFSELIRIPARRGEYGPGDIEMHVERITALANKFEAHCFERTRPNGHTHLVQGEPLFVDQQLVGFITTYTDITERKAAETALRTQHNQLQTVIESIPSAVSLFDSDGNLVLFNTQFPYLLDLPAELTKPGVSIEAMFRFNAMRGEYGPGDPEKIVATMMERARNLSPHSFERTRPNGKTLEVRGVPLAEGGFVTVYTDITERRTSAEREQLAQKVYSHTPAGIIFTDEEHRILSINPATTQMTGYEPFELNGQSVFGLISLSEELTQKEFQAQISLRGSWSGELEVTQKNGSNFPAGARINRVDDPQSGQPAHYVWILADITERKQAEDRMRHIAQHDALTGLPNRLALLMRLAQLLPEARRHGWMVAIMFIDLDRFKVINDTLGHQVGDELLREVACRLSNLIRETDFVARLGGDEFVIILPGITSPADAAIIAGKIISALSTAIEAEGHELHTSPSIGISIFPDDGPDGDVIVKNADTAMYHAKAAGRNNYQFFAADMNRTAAERLNIERKLRHAIARNELSLVFQPQFCAKDTTPTGVEALVRWHHPTDGMISPARFIPVAEETGMIVEIGDWVLSTACHEMARWINAGLKPIRIAVNVSARQLRRRDFCETVANALTTSGLPAELLELEITESSVMENPQEAIHILERLGHMGVTLAIDDFGTGYSSLAYLKLFPIDHLKIDRSFVADIEHDLNDRAIAFGTIALAHSLGLNVIAEGVETEDQHQLLRANGCDEVQGFLFSKPLTGAAAFAFLHACDAAE
ncbi:EAL domain-containing protein [Ferribacterium limneticum]|uniref:EAL domain-containing protein n=1 Tax=Ferribacterium limneticum TaxID=76259 RepID=UPI001CF9CDDB|nr:EAL domain-containing protein [Ferribacterium limneticum]UCV27897.1 PAS-domain containing protein [Ferribacterium limneticum]UCV31814.1 PAS-domain containing protein [Ferribacterium limneticum]